MNPRERASLAKEEARAERLAALNLMEDVLAARRETERANTALRKSEEEKALLLRLSDALRKVSDSVEIQQTAMRLLAERLGLSRAYYFRVEGNEEDGWIHIIDHAYQGVPGSLSMIGRHLLKNFGSGMFSGFARGEVIAVADVNALPALSATELRSYRALGVTAFINVPLLRDGEYSAGIGAHDPAPHPWTADEVALIREVASRMWASIERARAEETVRESEAWMAGQKEAFQAALDGAALDVSLGLLVRTIVAQMGAGARCGFYIANDAGTELRHVAGLPEDFVKHNDGVLIGPDQPGCGKAVCFGQPIITENVYTSPGWASWRWMAEAYNFRGVWSFPIPTVGGQVLGTFAVYFPEPRQAAPRDYVFAANMGRAAGIIISRNQEARRRLRAEMALRQSEKTFAALVEHAPFGVYLIDSEFHLRTVNAGSRVVFAGIEPLIGREFSEILRILWPEPFAGEVIERFWHTLHSGKSFISPPILEQRANIDEIQSYDWQLHRITLPDGTYGVVCYFYDLSNQKRLEAALRASEERLRGAISISTVGVLFWRDCRLSEVNEAFLRMNGFSREEILGQTWEELTSEEFYEASRRSIEELASRGESTPFEKQFRCRDGTLRWGLFTGRVVGQEVVEFVIDVTDRRSAEQAVHESEHRLRMLADAVPQIIWTNSGEGVANYFNKRWYEYSGLAFEQSVGLAWEAIVHPDDVPRSVPAWRSALAAGVIFDTEYRLRGADGEYRWFIGRNVPMHNGDGKVAGWFGTATDIHDWKRAEQAWRSSEERFRIALEAAEMAAWDYDVRANTVVWNEQHFRILGLEPQSGTVTPEFFLSFVHPEDFPVVSQRLSAAAQTSGVYRAEFRMIRADNHAVRWMSGFGKAMSSEEGHATRMSGVMLDVTERREAEEALAATQERLRLIVDSAQEHAIISMDLKRRVESWSPGAEAIFGFARDEILGQCADVIFTEEDQAAGVPLQEAKTALTEGRAGDNRWQRRKDGSRFWANGAMLPMRSQVGGPVVGLVKILRDETPAREAEQEKERHRSEIWSALQEMERARADAEAARALAEAAGEAKDHFLAVLSHELRTPLTPVAMATQALARRKDLPDPVREALAMIQRNILLEARMVDDLLDVTKIERGKLELMLAPVSLHEVIHSAVETTRSNLETKSQVLILDLTASTDVLQGDAGRLQQVIWNLLRNASKFTPAGGQLHIRSWNEQAGLLIAVSDTGIGIDAEALPKIFGAFTQASVSITRQFGGLGLGLAIAQAIVLAHQGELRVTSKGLGRGATFTVSLPLRPGTAALGV